MTGTKNIAIHKIGNGSTTQKEDCIVEESPLQIVIEYSTENTRIQESLSVTMRTPGDDKNLVAGFLFCEGFIQHASDIISIKHIGNVADESVILVELAYHVYVDIESKKRNFVSAASCGFCGKTNADIISQQVFAPLNNNFQINAQQLYQLPQLLNTSQNIFTQTGGSHAVALINGNAELIHICEDVGRHNAMDKLVGTMLFKNLLPLKEHVVLFSGRLGYELVQKSLTAGIPVVCAIGAPSSLAVELAAKNGMTIIGFLKNNSFNIYCGEERIIQS
ncbi:formate dehydrogenase accessory sulfurtransferase FdhD [Panacibacter ginsenosidivorans]|uniref:Sulfur carrier protein FdhD n=1 Tax=Panacibacter ginsenosidivorans TaxID=1813871 RepID=A0A5B8V8X3_9BACT|nr:formate dehydrogenase accessory sulfurtransferase FdhD [Panacibacter ginsenosidivorans]QEC67166.1 formate dehydrogenase accessory sulfurtransferase FdhD [Panacibacter ginsenosidivorans]